MAIIDNFTQEELRKIVEECNSFHELTKKLGYTTCGGRNNDTIRKRLKKYNISTDHFLTTKKECITRTEENVFCENSTATQTTLRKWYKKRKDILYRCECCGISEWRDKKLVLQLDHKNGKNHDNRLENLRWLCPNCHSQTDTFCGKQIKKEKTEEKKVKKLSKIKKCADCGVKISDSAYRCQECARKARQLCERPTREELKQMIRTLPFTKIGENYEVTDNSIRKWCKNYNLPSKKKDINNITDEEWEKI